MDEYRVTSNLRSTPVRVPMRGLCQSFARSNPHKGDFIAPGAFSLSLTASPNFINKANLPELRSVADCS